MSQIRQEIVIFQDSQTRRPSLSESIQAKGHSVFPCTSVAEALATLNRLAEPIFLREIVGKEDDARSSVKELLETETLRKFPVILLVRGADQYDGLLNRFFRLAVSVEGDSETSEIIEVINFIAERREELLSEPTPKLPESAVDFSTGTHAVNRDTTWTNFKSIHHLFFSQLDTLKLNKRSLGGKEYIKAVTPENFRDHSYLPETKKVEPVLNQIWQASPNWVRCHSHRVAFMTHRILVALDVPDPLREQAQIASFLYTWCVERKSVRLLKNDLLMASDGPTRSELCSKIKDSAMKVAVELELVTSGKVIAKLGKLVGDEEVADDSEESLAASAILASDIIDRFCWQAGYWKPQAAYTLFKMCRDGELNQIHPAILCCALKLLFEAVSATDPTKMLPGKVSKTKAAMAASHVADELLTENEVRVPIASLSPGMKLSRPIVAIDGKHVLAEDLILDQDLIWRIWNLSAVRPLNAPLIVQDRAPL